jgi:hypothetical protein
LNEWWTRFEKHWREFLSTARVHRLRSESAGGASFLLGARETKSAHKGVQPKRSETYKTHYENK